MRRVLWAFLFIALVAAGVGFFSMREEKGVAVEVQSAARKDVFKSYVTASGEIVASEYVDVGSNVMGRIVELPVKEGQPVRLGRLLARIDPAQAASEYEAGKKQVQALEAEVEVAQRQVDAARSQNARSEAIARDAELSFKRTQRLLGQGVVSQAQLDQDQAALDAARADVAAGKAEIERAERFLAASQQRVEQARAQLVGARDIFGKTEIRSPMDGVISRLLVREGEMVVVGIQNAPGTTLMTVSNLEEINAEVKVAEADILRVRLGQTADVTLDAVPQRVFGGKVIEIGTSALSLASPGAAAREFKVVVRLEQPDPGLRPGLTCDAEILTDQLSGVIVVPLQAVVLRERDGSEVTGVFLNINGQAAFRPVKTGIIGGLEVEVVGLSEGDLVITGPFQVLRTLQEGAKLAS